jgi:hypothetical protein
MGQNELTVERIKFYSVPYILAIKRTRWLFYLLYPETYSESFAPGELYVERPWYIVPHMTRHGVFVFEVDLNGEYFIVSVCPQTVVEALLKEMMPESVTFILKTKPPVAIDVHREGVMFFRQWLNAVKKNPKSYFQASEQFYQCTHSMTI